MLDADRLGVVGPVAGVPGDVLVPHHLRHRAVGGAEQVVRAGAGGGVLEPADRAGVAALHGVDDDVVDRVRRLAAGDRVVGRVGRHPGRRAVVGAQGAEVAGAQRRHVGVPPPLGRDRAAVHADLAAGRGRDEAPGEQVVHGVGVQPGGGRVRRAAVAGDRAVPLVDVVALRRGQPGLVGVGAQNRRRAGHVRRVPGTQFGAVQPGPARGLVERAHLRVAGQVHHAVSAGGAGLAAVTVQAGLGVPERGEQVARHVGAGGGPVEGGGERLRAVLWRGLGRLAGQADHEDQGAAEQVAHPTRGSPNRHRHSSSTTGGRLRSRRRFAAPYSVTFVYVDTLH